MSHYRVEVESERTVTERSYSIVGPDGVALSVMYTEKDAADEYADECNYLFGVGFIAGVRAGLEAAAVEVESDSARLRDVAARAFSAGRETVSLCRQSDAETCERNASAIRALDAEAIAKEAERAPE